MVGAKGVMHAEIDMHAVGILTIASYISERNISSYL